MPLPPISRSKPFLGIAVVGLCGTLAAGEVRGQDAERGVWLRGAAPGAEAWVQYEPVLRVRRFRVPGGVSLLAEAPSPEVGLRVAVMEPEQNALSYEVTQQPATLVEQGVNRVTARTAVAPQSQLSLELTAELAEDEPTLHLTYRLTNHGSAERTLSIWSLAALARRGFAVAPTGDKPRARRRIVLPFWAMPGDSLRFGLNAVLLDFDPPMGKAPAFKVGLITEAGEVAAVQDGQALLMASPYVAGAVYPEGGANVTLFELDDKDGRSWAEIEQVGPLTKVAPDGTIERRETLRLLMVEEPGEKTVDAWWEVVGAAAER